MIGYLRKFAAEWRLDSLDAADKDLRRNGVILTHYPATPLHQRLETEIKLLLFLLTLKINSSLSRDEEADCGIIRPDYI